jgi:HEAT repeat protein
MVPLLIDTARRYPAVTIHAITALGKLGGEEARQFLVGLLDDGDSLADFAGGQISKDDLRLAIVKALGSIGDDGSIDKIKKYKDNLSTTQKLFFKNSPVNKAITDILSKQ